MSVATSITAAVLRWKAHNRLCSHVMGRRHDNEGGLDRSVGDIIPLGRVPISNLIPPNSLATPEFLALPAHFSCHEEGLRVRIGTMPSIVSLSRYAQQLCGHSTV